MIIIGITGTLGAGKGAIVDYLKSRYGFLHFSARDFIVEEIQQRQLPVNRDTMTTVANDLRRKYGPSYIIDELYKKAEASGRNSVIESIRTPGEVEALRRRKPFVLLAVDADPQLRYRRIKARQSATDQVDFETFMANEQREFNSDDSHKQNLSKCIEMADYVLRNDGTLEDLNKQIEHIMLALGKLDEPAINH